LPPEAGRDFFAVQAITFRPFVRIVIRSEDPIDPRKVDGKVLMALRRNLKNGSIDGGFPGGDFSVGSAG